MAGDEINITITGNLTADPELKYTPSGAPVANFTVASTPRTFDRQANEWRDGVTRYTKCSAWRALGENVAASLHKGDRVVVEGKFETKSFTDREGKTRTTDEVIANDVGASLKRATVEVNRQRGGTPQGNGQQAPAQPQASQPQQSATDDPWASASAADDDPWA